MAQTATSAVLIRTHEGDDCDGYTPHEGWEDYDAALQRSYSEQPEDVPGLLDAEDGYALFARDSEFGQRALAAGAPSGVAVEGDAQFAGEADPVAYRADDLREAGANPDLYDLGSVTYFLAWTFFASK